MLGHSPKPVDIAARIAAAQRFREQIVTEFATPLRLVSAEADFLPGLIIDRYNDTFAIQALDQGMEHATPEIVAALEERILAARDCAQQRRCPVAGRTSPRNQGTVW